MVFRLFRLCLTFGAWARALARTCCLEHSPASSAVPHNRQRQLARPERYGECADDLLCTRSSHSEAQNATDDNDAVGTKFEPDISGVVRIAAHADDHPASKPSQEEK